jgi:hypothetical protein
MDFVVIGMTLVGLLIGSVIVGVFLVLHEANQWSDSAMAPRARRFVRRDEFPPGKLR